MLPGSIPDWVLPLLLVLVWPGVITALALAWLVKRSGRSSISINGLGLKIEMTDSGPAHDRMAGGTSAKDTG